MKIFCHMKKFNTNYATSFEPRYAHARSLLQMRYVQDFRLLGLRIAHYLRASKEHGKDDVCAYLYLIRKWRTVKF